MTRRATRSLLLVASSLFSAILSGNGWAQEAPAAISGSAGSRTSQAAPDLNPSIMYCPPPRSIAGKPLPYEIALRNTGAIAPDKLSVTTDLPANMLFAGGSSGVTVNGEQRAIRWEGRLPPGEETNVRWAIIAAPDSAGSWANTRTFIGWDNWSERDGFWHQDSATRNCESELVDRPPAPGSEPSTFLLLASLALLPLVMASVFALVRAGESRRGKQSLGTGAPSATPGPRIDRRLILAMSLGFVASIWVTEALIALVVLPNVRAFTAYREASCTVLDRSLQSRQSTSTGSGGKRTTYFAPMYAVRYQADGAEQVAMGPGVWGGMDTASESRAAEALSAYAPGTAYPCWYDPDDYRVFVFTRRPGGFSLMIVFPLMLMWLTGRALKKMILGRW